MSATKQVFIHYIAFAEGIREGEWIKREEVGREDEVALFYSKCMR